MAKEGLVPRSTRTRAKSSLPPPLPGNGPGRESNAQMSDAERLRLQWSLGLLGSNPQVPNSTAFQ